MAESLPFFQRYPLESKLGQGSFATTFLSHDSQTGHPCVVKELSFQQAEGWKSIELFEREATVLANLEHPHIPRFMDFVTEGDKAWLVQEFIAGQTLKQVVESGKRFSEPEIIQLALGVLDILDYLHHFSPPFIHRDIKPSNLMITPQGQVYLVDFGAVADSLRHANQGGSTIVGTFGYMPPEQFDGRAVPASDIYALGASLIYALSRLEPGEIEKDNLKLHFRPHINVSAGLAFILEKMIEPDWKKRYQQAREVIQDLESVHLGHYRVPQKRSGMETMNRVILAIASVIVMGGIGIVVLSWSSSKPLQSEKVTEQLQPLGQAPIQGTLHVDGTPLDKISTQRPRFWMRDENSGKEVSPQFKYRLGAFAINGLPPGNYGLNVTLDAAEENPPQYPGDLRVWKTFVYNGKDPVELNLGMMRVLHLLKPQDNNQKMPGWNQACEGKVDLSGPTTFAWESLGAEIHYDYEVLQVICPYQSASAVTSGSVTTTEVRLDLPLSPPNTFYMFKLTARHHGEQMGILMTHGANGHGWDYRFRQK